MHELTIAENIIRTVEEEVASRNLTAVKRIGLRIGALSDIVPDALKFNFEAITRDTILEATKLEIEEVPLQAKCKACKTTFEIKELYFLCPKCESTQIVVTHGQELEFAYLEVEDETEAMD